MVLIHVSFIVIAGLFFLFVKRAAAGESSPGSAGINTAPVNASSDNWQRGHAAALPLAKTSLIVAVIANVVAVVGHGYMPQLVMLWLNIPVVLLIILGLMAMQKATAAVQ